MANGDARAAFVKKAAKQFSTGNFTASQTGAKQFAKANYDNAQTKAMVDAIGGTSDFENMINGAPPAPRAPRPTRTKGN